MLLRHSFYYLFARGLPGLLNFAALAIYTRLLTAEEFGRYVLVLAGVSLLEVVVFQWLSLVLARFIPAHRDEPHTVKQSVLALFFLLAALVCGLGLTLVLIWPDPVWRALIALAVPLTVAQAWLQLNLALASARLQPSRYGRLLGGKSGFALILGAGLAWIGLGTQAPLIGLLLGHVVAWLLFGLSAWRGIRPQWPVSTTLRKYCGYGLPLIVTFALGWAIALSDRVLIAWLMDEAAAGIYAAGYDLAQQSLGLLLSVANTAAYPLVLHKLEHEGQAAAHVQLRINGELVVTLALAVAAGLIALSPAIVDIVVGEQFRAGAQAVMPWIAAVAAVAGIKAFHLDIAFHLARQSRWLVVTGGGAAITNVVLTLILVPSQGILGAAWAAMAAFFLAALASGILGKKVFSSPPLLPMLARGTAVAVCTYAGAWFVMQFHFGDLLTLLLGGVVGGGLGLAAAILLNVAGIRAALRTWSRSIVKKTSHINL